jgi:ribosomal protein L18
MNHSKPSNNGEYGEKKKKKKKKKIKKKKKKKRFSVIRTSQNYHFCVRPMLRIPKSKSRK